METYIDMVPLVRLLTGDKDPEKKVFEDWEIEELLKLNDGNVYRAAADALDAIASNAAYTLKVATVLDVSVSGDATAEAIRQSAAALRARADADDQATIVCGTASTLPVRIPTHLRPWWEAMA